MTFSYDKKLFNINTEESYGMDHSKMGIGAIARERGRESGKTNDPGSPHQRLDALTRSAKEANTRDSNINFIKPEYYNFGVYEPKRVYRAWNLSGDLYQALKYIARIGKAGRPNDDLKKGHESFVAKRVEDLRKAQTYIQFEIDHLLEGVSYENEPTDAITDTDIDKHWFPD